MEEDITYIMKIYFLLKNKLSIIYNNIRIIFIEVTSIYLIFVIIRSILLLYIL